MTTVKKVFQSSVQIQIRNYVLNSQLGTQLLKQRTCTEKKVKNTVWCIFKSNKFSSKSYRYVKIFFFSCVASMHHIISDWLKTFVLIFAPIYRLNKSMLVAESLPADLRWLISHNIIVYDDHRLPGMHGFYSVTEVSKCMMPSV